ncbi:GNAT family N-acetyltransferase [Kurthia sibirica]|uniref:GNAT family N-acetyltransferase n=1 Tax=Kurthia sibirica TaxID=202750 RepID=A0A2U3AKL6_9BACL|nr:GNAT family N-acetyltransferase [Kurthia sibirica]PWI25061.1 GNAT family N-acetyltransferase [Kurthia sibirica]GEK34226.1 acetyltransferase [Kurthia sibirica]
MNSIKITNNDDLQRALKIRKEVFVKEQKVPEDIEVDEFDILNGACSHVLLTVDQEAVGTGRVRLVEHYGKLQRVAILQSYRKHGFGKVIILKLEELASELGATKVKLDAQVHAIGFYEKLGYEVQSDVFQDAGIDHVLMVKSL